MIGTVDHLFVTKLQGSLQNTFSTVGMYAFVAAAVQYDIKRGRTVF